MNPTAEIVTPEAALQNQQADSGVNRGAPEQPVAIYEVHVPSWMRVPEEQNRPLTYSEIAPKLAEYSKFMGFTHVQLICPRFHDSQELRVLLDRLHAEELGVILETDLPPNDRNGKKESVDGHCMGGETFIFEHE